ncbi:MAG: SRPBCC family protein [Thermomicrobiales bacterium]
MAKTRIVAEPGVPQIVITRAFAAPRDLLFRAYTDPALLVQWMGPRWLTTTVDDYDVRDGGTWRYVSRDIDGSVHGFHGLFHGTPSVDAGIVQTFEYEGWPGKVSLQTLTFEEQNGHTLVRMNSVYQSVADRDAMVASGMEVGVNEGMERLEDLLANLTHVR